ncbi:hypothetical protein ACO0QE_001702 [Hanseniaspora vineae]
MSTNPIVPPQDASSHAAVRPSRPKRSGSMRKSLLIMNTPPSMKKYEAIVNNTSYADASPQAVPTLHSSMTNNLQSSPIPRQQSPQHPYNNFQHHKRKTSNLEKLKNYDYNTETDSDGEPMSPISPEISSQHAAKQNMINVMKNQHHQRTMEQLSGTGPQAQSQPQPQPQSLPSAENSIDVSIPIDHTAHRIITPTPLQGVSATVASTPGNNDLFDLQKTTVITEHSTPQSTVKKPLVRRSGSMTKRHVYRTQHGSESNIEIPGGVSQHRRIRSMSIPNPIANPATSTTDQPDTLSRVDDPVQQKRSRPTSMRGYSHNGSTASLVEPSRTPSPVRPPTSDQIFALLASKESQILETKNQIDEIKRQLRSKESELIEQYKELEELKQNMSMELIKSHNGEIDEVNKSNMKLKPVDMTLNPPKGSNRLSFTGNSTPVPPKKAEMAFSPNDQVSSGLLSIKKKSSQFLSSFSNPTSVSTHTNDHHDQADDFSFSDDVKDNGVTEEMDFEQKIGKVVIPSTPSSIYHKSMTQNDQNLEQFKNNKKNEVVATTIYEEENSDDNIAPKRETQIRRNNTVNRNKRASRMSMYFSKGMNLINQFDQILQSELEKKLGIEDTDNEKPSVKDRGADEFSQEEEEDIEQIDSEEANTSVHKTDLSKEPEKPTAESQSGYKYFFA